MSESSTEHVDDAKDALRERIVMCIRERDLHAARDLLEPLPPADIAELMEEIPVEDGIVIFRILPRETTTDIFEFLSTDAQAALISSLSSKRVAILLNEMAADDRTALFEEMPAGVVKQLVLLLDKEQRTVALSLLGYPESSVGRLMTPDYIGVKAEWSISEVLEHVRSTGHADASLDVLYVLNPAGKLIGELRIHDVLLSDPSTRVDEIMDESVVSLSAMRDQEDAVQLFVKHGRTVLPVVDSEGLLIGIVTVDDALDVAEEEATEDIQKFGGTEALHEPYLKAPFSRLVQTRATWLVVLFVGEMLTASAMAVYEDEIAKAVVLALFVPLIISSGGNSGSQAATLVIRAISLGEVSMRDWKRVLQREITTGLLLGLLLGGIGFFRILVASFFTDLYGPHWALIGLTVALSLVFVVLLGTITGAMFPLILKRIGADPAASSAPFVATLVDVSGLLLYFTVASIVLAGTLL